MRYKKFVCEYMFVTAVGMMLFLFQPSIRAFYFSLTLTRGAYVE